MFLSLRKDFTNFASQSNTALNHLSTVAQTPKTISLPRYPPKRIYIKIQSISLSDL